MKTKEKRASTKNSKGAPMAILSVLLVLIAFAVLMATCKKEDVVTPLTSSPTSGTDKINTYDDTWSLDKAHSNVNWATMYYGDNALLNGKFNKFGIKVDFDEASPQNGKIEAWVQLSSFNTGESGRDGTDKCGPGYMGVVWTGGAGDTLIDGSKDPAFNNPATDTAWFSSTSIEQYGDGYLATGTLTFKSVTKTQDLYFTYLGQKDYSDPLDGSNIKGGISGEFTFNALTDYGVTSTSIADQVTVMVNANFKKN